MAPGLTRGSTRPVRIFAQLIRKNASTPEFRNSAIASVETRVGDRIFARIRWALSFRPSVTTTGIYRLLQRPSQCAEVNTRVSLSVKHMAQIPRTNTPKQQCLGVRRGRTGLEAPATVWSWSTPLKCERKTRASDRKGNEGHQ